MPTRRQAFQATAHELESEFRTRFPAKPTAQTQSVLDRIRRSLSWLLRAADLSQDDRPPRFVYLWIALNALYGQLKKELGNPATEKGCFEDFLARLNRLPSGKKELARLVSARHVGDLGAELVENRYLWKEWWDRDLASYDKKSGEQLVAVKNAVVRGDPLPFFGAAFDPLQVLRNQIFHGSSSATTRKNRDALYPAVLLLEDMLPCFISLMIKEGMGVDWPAVPFPGRETPQFPE